MLSMTFSRLVKALQESTAVVPSSLEEIISQTSWYKGGGWSRTTTSSINYLGEEFYLTGSRWFLDRARDEKTDYDFFTRYSEDMISHLTSKGFSALYKGNLEYIDGDCLVVLRKEASAQFPQIDVQLVRNIGHRVLLRDLLKTLGYEFWSTVDKPTACKLWDITHKMIMLPSPLGDNEDFPPLRAF